MRTFLDLYASATSHFQHFFCFPEPPTLLWLREHGTICPFGVFPCLEVMFGSIWGQSLWWGRLWSCWVFPCFVGISAVYGSCPNSPFVLFDPHHGPFYAPKTSRFKGEMSKFAKNATKLGKTPKGQMLPIYPCLPAFLRSGNSHNLKNPQVCHVPVWNPSCATGRFEFTARQLPKTRNRCLCAIHVGESSV